MAMGRFWILWSWTSWPLGTMTQELQQRSFSCNCARTSGWWRRGSARWRLGDMAPRKAKAET
eukprot:scaffold2963_cov250-Pinguiococcus_pyrenoidosus.AAC.21